MYFKTPNDDHITFLHFRRRKRPEEAFYVRECGILDDNTCLRSFVMVFVSKQYF